MEYAVTKPLGTIEAVDIRTVWSSESSDFTPWLAEPTNIALIAQAVGLDLEVQSVEKPVGAFRADILCKDVNSGASVLIENQLERSDHGHLGQLLTYAGGLDAATIIWVAPKFCEEHRAALDWLNRITDRRFNFFAIQVELWSISGSLPAPNFTIVAAPNNWTRDVKKADRENEMIRSESAQRRFDYWQTFLSNLRLSDNDIKLPNPNSLGNVRFNLKGRDLWITVYAGSSIGRIGVSLKGSSEYYEMFARNRPAIEQQIGERAVWNGDGDDWSVEITSRADPTVTADWPAQHKLLGTWLGQFISAFRPYMDGLDYKTVGAGE